jgi:type I restriction enzyme S subunit
VSAVLTAQEPSAKYLVNLQPPLVRHFDLIAQAPGGVPRLRELILTLAVQGKLVPQDPNDEPASELLKKIRAEKDRLIAEGKIKRDKPLAESADEEKPFELPASWTWTRFGDVSINRDGERIPVSSSDRESRAKIYDYYGASGVIDKIDGYLFEKTLLLIGEDGANLINRSTPIAFLAHGKYWVNNHAHVIDATHHQLLDYLALFINSISLRPYVTGTAQPKMNQAKLNSILVAVPPLAEQSRIVTRVEELMQLCDTLEASGQLEAQQHAQLVGTLLGTLTQSETLEELADSWQRIATHFDVLLDRPEAVDALEQTILQLAVRGLLVPQDPTDEPVSILLQKIRTEKDHLIAQGKIKRDKPLPPITDEEKPFELPQGWEWVTIDTLASVGTGTTPSRDNTAFFDNGAIPWVTSGETGQPFIRKTEQHVTEAALAQTSLTIYPVGTLVVAMYGQGKTRGQVSELCIPATTNQACAAIVLVESSTAHKDYVKLVFEKSYDEIRELSAGGAQPNLNVGKVKATLIPLPPLDEQNRIVTCVNTLRELFTELRRRLTACHVNQAQLAHVLAASN